LDQIHVEDEDDFSLRCIKSEINFDKHHMAATSYTQVLYFAHLA